jgi:septum formation inhibitor MinC
LNTKDKQLRLPGRKRLGDKEPSHEARSSEEYKPFVTARGTLEGLIVRIENYPDFPRLVASLNEFITLRKRFLEGNEIILEWIGGVPANEVVESLESTVFLPLDIQIRGSRPFIEERDRSEGLYGSRTSTYGQQDGLVKRGLLSGIDTFEGKPLDFETETLLKNSNTARLSNSAGRVPLAPHNSQVPPSSVVRPMYSSGGDVPYDSPLWDEADSRVICTTLRSGQRVDTEHTLVILGDVNSGAEVYAGGDIIVLGNLRGVAHAGAYESSGGGRVIFALNLQPTQLRIGQVITRGGEPGGSQPEVARVEGETIVVEPYNSRHFVRRVLGSVPIGGFQR